MVTEDNIPKPWLKDRERNLFFFLRFNAKFRRVYANDHFTFTIVVIEQLANKMLQF